MKSKLLVAVLLMTANIVFGQTWSHSRSHLNKDGSYEQEHLTDVQRIFPIMADDISGRQPVTTYIVGFEYYNKKDLRTRRTPQCSCKLIEDGTAEQVFTSFDKEKTRVVLKWTPEGNEYFYYFVHKWRGNTWVNVSTEVFLKNY